MVSLRGIAAATAAIAAAVAPLATMASSAAQLVPGCSSGQCLGADGGEEGSLLQAPHLPAAWPLRAPGGCPPPWQWTLLEEAARSQLLGEALREQLPLSWNLTLDREPIGVGGCRANLTGHAALSLDARVAGARGVWLSQFTCDRAVCTSPARWGCRRYEPLETTTSLEVDSVHVRALAADVAVSWDEGCAGGAGSFSLQDADLGFTVTGARLTGANAMDITMAPFNVSSFALSALTLSYESVTDVRCNVNNEPVKECLDVVGIWKTEEYKRMLQDMINGLIRSLGEPISKFVRSGLLDHTRHSARSARL